MNFIKKIEDLQKQICCLKNSSGNPDIDLVNNGNGTFTFTNGVDAPVTFDVKKTIVVDNGNDTYTITDDFGTSITIDLNNVSYVPAVTVGNTLGTITINGLSQTIKETITNVGTPTLSAANVLTIPFTNETGVLQNVTVDLSTLAVDVNIASMSYNPLTGVIELVETDGTIHTIDIGPFVETITNYQNSVVAGHLIGQYENEAGVIIDVFETVTTLSLLGSVLTYVNENGVSSVIDIKNAETTTTLVDNLDGTFTYTNEDGVVTTFNTKGSLVNNNDGTYTFTDAGGVVTIINTNGLVVSNTQALGKTIATLTELDGTIVDIKETITSTSQLANGDIEYANENAIVSKSVILSTDVGQLIKSGTDKGNLLLVSDIISTDAGNTIVIGTDGKPKVNPVVIPVYNQVISEVDSDTVNLTITPSAPTPTGQINYTVQADVKTQCEIDSNSSGIKLSDGFYENIGTAHITTLPTLTAFDPAKEVKQVNIVKNGCSLKAFVNKDEEVLNKFHGVSDLDLNALSDISIGGVSPDVISIIVTSLAADFDFSSWYINTLTTGKKVGQKFIVALEINTPLFSMTYDHANAGFVKAIFDKEILTVKALEADTLYED